MAKDKTPIIRYICLSDLHLGEEDSLLTDVDPADGSVDLSRPSPVLVALVRCLESLIGANRSGAPKPTLVLCGDVLELALAQTHEAASVFGQFINLLMTKNDGLVDNRIVYVPGNHDHHMWELGRESQYADKIASLPSGAPLPEAYHATGMFLDAKGIPLPRCQLLTQVANRAAGRSDLEVGLAYPNHAVVCERGRKERCVVFHHGHFIEKAYHATSEFRTLVFSGRTEPKDIYQLEGENFAWIDFVWSALGRSGGVGEDVETIYERTKDPEAFKALLASFAREFAQRYDIPIVPGDWMEEKALKWAFEKLTERFGGLERHHGSGVHRPPALPLSADAQRGLARYMDPFVYGQIRKERGALLDGKERISGTLTFVFGHTHKPFSRPMRFSHRYTARVPVYNTGGWVVEGIVPDETHGGSVVLVDDNCDVVNVRLYKEGSDRAPSVEEALPPGDTHSNLYNHIDQVIKPKRAEWSGFSSEVERAVYVRAENLRKRIHAPE